MATFAPLFGLLPAPLLRALDGWSHRRAVARQLRRQQAWLARKAPPPVPLHVQYKLKPWRD
jgi:hypothetical protein